MDDTSALPPVVYKNYGDVIWSLCSSVVLEWGHIDRGPAHTRARPITGQSMMTCCTPTHGSSLKLNFCHITVVVT